MHDVGRGARGDRRARSSDGRRCPRECFPGRRVDWNRAGMMARTDDSVSVNGRRVTELGARRIIPQWDCGDRRTGDSVFRSRDCVSCSPGLVMVSHRYRALRRIDGGTAVTSGWLAASLTQPPRRRSRASCQCAALGRANAGAARGKTAPAIERSRRRRAAAATRLSTARAPPVGGSRSRSATRR